jgi:hypothetical protein
LEIGASFAYRQGTARGAISKRRNQMAAKKTTGKSKGLKKGKRLEAAKPLTKTIALKAR